MLIFINPEVFDFLYKSESSLTAYVEGLFCPLERLIFINSPSRVFVSFLEELIFIIKLLRGYVRTLDMLIFINSPSSVFVLSLEVLIFMYNLSTGFVRYLNVIRY